MQPSPGETFRPARAGRCRRGSSAGGDLEFIVAMVTPATPGGEVDAERFGAMTEFFRERGATGILPSGTTGEFASLSIAQRRRLFEVAARKKGDLWFLAGAGCTNLPETQDLIACAADCGADAALVLPPFYFRQAPLKGLVRYFERLLQSSRLPVVYYHIPQNTGIAAAREILAPLAAHDRLLGVKDSSGSREELRALVHDLPGKKVWVGSEALLAEALAAGAFGGVSALANVFPHLVREVLDTVRAGRNPAAAQERAATAREVVNRYATVPALRFLLSELRGIDPGPPFLPLVSVSPEQGKSLLEDLRRARIL